MEGGEIKVETGSCHVACGNLVCQAPLVTLVTDGSGVSLFSALAADNIVMYKPWDICRPWATSWTCLI